MPDHLPDPDHMPDADTPAEAALDSFAEGGPPLLEVQDYLCFALYSASQAFTRAYRPFLAPLGLTYPQYLVMQLLWRQDGQGLRDLARILHLDSGTLTPLLKRLEANGLVVRRRDTVDERVVRLHLTPRGQDMRDAAAHVPACVARKLGMSLEEAATLQRQVMKLRAALDAPDAAQPGTDGAASPA